MVTESSNNLVSSNNTSDIENNRINNSINSTLTTKGNNNILRPVSETDLFSMRATSFYMQLFYKLGRTFLVLFKTTQDY